MYYLGEKLESLNGIDWSLLAEKKKSFSKLKIDQVIDVLDNFAKLWLCDSSLYKEAFEGLKLSTNFSEEEIQKTLKVLPVLLSKHSLVARIKAEFINENVLDQFSKTSNFQGKVKAVPAGIVLHVTAGNVFLSCIDSLIMGFLTKNISLVKVSSQNQFFPNLFAKALNEFDKEAILSDKFAILHWRGGDEAVENLIKSRVNAIIAWGGEETVRSYKQSLPLGVKLIDFGPKISFQIISSKGIANKNLKLVAEKIVADIIPWDQAACSSPQNLFIQEGLDIPGLLKELESAFAASPERGQLSADESVEILKEKYRALYSELMEEGKVISGENFLVHVEKNKFLKTSPLHRSLIVKEFSDFEDLTKHVEPYSYYLQSCSYLVGDEEKDEMLTNLSSAGIKRFAPLGTITWGMDGAPHDGRYVLRELVHFIVDEERIQNYGEESIFLQSSADLKDYFDHHSHPNGYIFSSGGTTGEPKYVHFSREEFDYVTDMLAKNFSLQGIKKGMTVANLFVAGNLWSSFMAVEKALEKIGAVQLPIGGLCSKENISQYLKKFKPQAVMGIPSLLVMTAEYMEALGESLEIENVFYAGEGLSEIRREYLGKVWNTKYFGSAGYASVDAGVIGFQCSSCGPGEHHLFEDLIDMKIVDGEAVVTSLYRTTLPIKNYQTGDRVEWIKECSSGIPGKRFKLLGRIDNIIQIWSCRLQLSDIEKSLQFVNPDILTFQVKIKEEIFETGVGEILEIYFEKPVTLVDLQRLRQVIFENSRDVKDTIAFDEFEKNVRIIPVEPISINRNPRTGKISLVVDTRH